MKALNVLLFDGFTEADTLGSAEALSRAQEGERKYCEIEFSCCWRARGRQYER